MTLPRVVSGLVVAIVMACAPLFAAQPPAAVAPPASDAPNYSFATSAGLLLFYVHPERAGDFEEVVSRLGAVLDQQTDPVRRQQAAGWRVFKGTESARDASIYFFVFDPAVPATDYDPIKWLGDAVPAEVQALYDRLRLDVIKVERLGLTKLR